MKNFGSNFQNYDNNGDINEKQVQFPEESNKFHGEQNDIRSLMLELKNNMSSLSEKMDSLLKLVEKDAHTTEDAAIVAVDLSSIDDGVLGPGVLNQNSNSFNCKVAKLNNNVEGVEESLNILTTLSKKDIRKEQRKLGKIRHKQEASALDSSTDLNLDPLSGNYGDSSIHEFRTREGLTPRNWIEMKSLNEELEGQEVLIRGRVQSVRRTSSKTLFLVLRQNGYTVQCVVMCELDLVSKQMVKYASTLSKESVVFVKGVVLRNEDVKNTTQKVEIRVSKLYCISRAIEQLPINLGDAIHGRVHMNTRLDNRVFDLKTPATQAIFAIEREVERIFRSFLTSKGFIEIHTPKLIAGSPEGGSTVFKLDYFGQPASLSQSPQLHKQMAICGGLDRVFEVGPAFRAEKSDTNRHLCEFIALVAEMTINEHYSEVMKIVDELFVAIFDGLNENCKEELEAVGKRFKCEPLKYLRETLVLSFQEGVKMLQEAGVEIGFDDDLNTEAEKKLGQLVLERYNTEFYILDRYPLKVRPFFTMPCEDDPKYSNSFDVFMRGEEIISGAQRIDDTDLLRTRAEACGIDVQNLAILTYLDFIRYGVPGPHGGFGVGLERVVMLFCQLQNIRNASRFPRDPKRLAP